MIDAVKVVQIKTTATAHVVVRNAKGHKLFDMDIHGVSITITVPPDAEIQIQPKSRGAH